MHLLYKLLRLEPGSRDGVVAATSVLGIIVNVLIAALKVAIGVFASSIAILPSFSQEYTEKFELYAYEFMNKILLLLMEMSTYLKSSLCELNLRNTRLK